MSIKTKMTAIADRLRAMLGTSDALSLDGMAAALATQQTQVADGFSAVAERKGTVPVTQLLSALPDTIRTIPDGVSVQTRTGSFTTSSSGKASVNCGFQPDLVAIYWMTSAGSGYEGEYWTCAPFALSKEGNEYAFNSLAWRSTAALMDVWIKRSATGFSAEIGAYSTSWSWSAYARKNIGYIAVKYTE